MTATMTDLGNVLTADITPLPSDDRLVIRFSTATHRIYGGNVKRLTRPLKGFTLLQYVERPAVTPTGGKYTSRRMTIRTADGRHWYGTMKSGSDVVRLRPAPTK